MQLSFANPGCLWLLPLVGMLGAGVWFHHTRKGAWLSRRRLFLSLASLLLCVLGLARPQLGEQVSHRKGKGANVFVAVDISRSMLAEDIQPSRLKFAKTAIQYLSDALTGSRLSLFPFAADGYIQVPLTQDLNTILSVLATLSPSMTTDQGTDLSTALDTLFLKILKMEKESQKRGEQWPSTQVLVFSDGESHHKIKKDVFYKYQNKNIPIFTVGTATAGGARIPLRLTSSLTSFRTSNFLKDSRGQFVSTKLDQDALNQISQLTGGQYFPARLSEMPRLGNQLQQKQRMTTVSTEMKVEAEYFPLLFLVALLLFFVEFSFGRWHYAIRLLPLCFFLVGAKSAEKQTVEGISAQIEATQDGETRSRLLHNLGVILAEKNDLEKAALSFQEASFTSQNPQTRKKTLFNLGNTLLQMQKPQEAIEAYQNAYDIDTEDLTFDKDTNTKLSENMALAAKILQQAQNSPQSGDGDPQSGPPKDPKGAKKNYKNERFSKARKRRIFDLLASEEQQTLQRLQRKQDKKRPLAPQAKTW